MGSFVTTGTGLLQYSAIPKYQGAYMYIYMHMITVYMCVSTHVYLFKCMSVYEYMSPISTLHSTALLMDKPG